MTMDCQRYILKVVRFRFFSIKCSIWSYNQPQLNIQISIKTIMLTPWTSLCSW